MGPLNVELQKAGFTEDSASAEAARQNAEAQGMNKNGKYNVQAVYIKGNVLVTVENNESPEDLGGYTAMVQHPALAVVASPKGRVAVNPTDVALVLAVANDLA